MTEVRKANRLVARAAAFFDRFYPGWHRKVKLTTLDLGDGCRCITAQLEIPRYAREDFPEYVLDATKWTGYRPTEAIQEPWENEIRRRRGRKVGAGS